MAKQFSFPKSLRLLSRRDFSISSFRKYEHKGQYIVVECKNNSLGYSRLGITVTRKFGKAFKRNRFKRMIRESFRLNRERLLPGLDIVVRALPPAATASFNELQQEFVEFLQKKE